MRIFARSGLKGWIALGDLLRRQHVAAVIKALLPGCDFGIEAIETFVGVAPIDIADGDNVLVGEIDEIGVTHAADADAGDVEEIAGRRVATAEYVARHDRESRRGGGRLREKRSARNGFFRLIDVLFDFGGRRGVLERSCGRFQVSGHQWAPSGACSEAYYGAC